MRCTQLTPDSIALLLKFLHLDKEIKKEEKKMRPYRFGDITRKVAGKVGSVLSEIVKDSQQYDPATLQLEVSCTPLRQAEQVTHAALPRGRRLHVAVEGRAVVRVASVALGSWPRG